MEKLPLLYYFCKQALKINGSVIAEQSKSIKFNFFCQIRSNYPVMTTLACQIINNNLVGIQLLASLLLLPLLFVASHPVPKLPFVLLLPLHLAAPAGCLVVLYTPRRHKCRNNKLVMEREHKCKIHLSAQPVVAPGGLTKYRPNRQSGLLAMYCRDTHAAIIYMI